MFTIMAVAMVAMLAFGGTYAYFTASASAVAGKVTTGYVKLSTTAESTTAFTQNVLPGDSMLAADITYTVDTTDEEGNYVFVKVTVTPPSGITFDVNTLSLGTGWTATGSNGVYYYNDAVADNGTAVVDADAFVLPTTITDNWTQGEDTSDDNLMNAEITVIIQAQSVQVSNQAEGATAATLAAAATWTTVTVD